MDAIPTCAFCGDDADRPTPADLRAGVTPPRGVDYFAWKDRACCRDCYLELAHGRIDGKPVHAT